MKYDTSDALRKAEFLNRANYLAGKGKLVELTELRSSTRRTQGQADCWWAWCSLIANAIGNPDIKAVARDVKREVLGRKIVSNVFTGEQTDEDYSTQLMTETEMSELLTRTKEWAHKVHSLWLPSREDGLIYEDMITRFGH